MTAKNTKIIDASRKYFFMIPHIVDDMGLSVYAYRLYCRMKRRAGESGECYESTNSLANACKMSSGAVSKAKQELLTAGLIVIRMEKSEHGGRPYHIITIVDVWENNLQVSTVNLQVQDVNLQVHHTSLASSPGAIKEEPFKKIGQAQKPRLTEPPQPDFLKVESVVIYRDIMKTTPSLEQRQAIYEQVTDFEAWRDCLNHWIMHGWNKRNVLSLLKNYAKGGRQDCNLCAREDDKKSGFPVMEWAK